MKVERRKEEVPFVPVVITLQSRAELDTMFDIVNVGFDQTLKRYCENNGLSGDCLSRFTSDLYNKLYGMRL